MLSNLEKYKEKEMENIIEKNPCPFFERELNDRK